MRTLGVSVVRPHLSAVEAAALGALAVYPVLGLHSTAEPARPLEAGTFLVVELASLHSAPLATALGAVVFIVRLATCGAAPPTHAMGTNLRAVRVHHALHLGLVHPLLFVTADAEAEALDFLMVLGVDALAVLAAAVVALARGVQQRTAMPAGLLGIIVGGQVAPLGRVLASAISAHRRESLLVLFVAGDAFLLPRSPKSAACCQLWRQEPRPSSEPPAQQ